MKTTLSLTLLATLLSAAPAPSQSKAEEAKAVREFYKKFRATRRRTPSIGERLAALKLLAGHDSVAIAQALVKAFDTLDKEIEAIEDERAEISAELRDLVKGKETDTKLVLEKSKFERYNRLSALSKAARARVDGLRQVQAEVGNGILELKQYKSLSWLMKNVLSDKRLSLLLKLTVASSAGAFDVAMLGDIQAALKRARRSTDLVALLQGIGKLGKDGRGLGPAVQKLLSHKDMVVRERAAIALAAIRYYEAIPAIIDLIEKTRGEQQKRIAAGLENMTAQQLGTSVASWRGWYEKEGKALIAKGELDKVGGKMFRSRAKPRSEGRYYMGIPQDGQAIVYVIDSSGSMKQPVKWSFRPEPGAGGTSSGRRVGADGEGHSMTRLEACKMELIKALERLDRSKTFDIIWYSDLPYRWRDTMQRAIPARIQEAQAWIRKLQPNRSTNIHDAMKMAFEFAKGRGIRDKSYSKDIGLDTIFLLSDGSPTTPDGKPDDPEKVIQAVRRWNPLKRVTVNTIGIGNALNAPFLSRLASENNGQFSHYTDSGKRKR